MAASPADLAERLTEIVEWLSQQILMDGSLEHHEWETLEFFSHQLRLHRQNRQRERPVVALPLYKLARLWHRISTPSVDELRSYRLEDWNVFIGHPRLPAKMKKHIFLQQSLSILRESLQQPPTVKNNNGQEEGTREKESDNQGDKINDATVFGDEVQAKFESFIETFKDKEPKGYRACFNLASKMRNAPEEVPRLLMVKPFDLDFFQVCFVEAIQKEAQNVVAEELECPLMMREYQRIIQRRREGKEAGKLLPSPARDANHKGDEEVEIVSDDDDAQSKDECIQKEPATRKDTTVQCSNEDEIEMPSMDGDNDECSAETAPKEPLPRPDGSESEDDEEIEEPEEEQGKENSQERRQQDYETKNQLGELTKRLKEVRTRLRATACDPMQEIRQVASTTQQGDRNGEAFYTKKRSARSLKFDDFSDDDDQNGRPGLSDLPEHKDFREDRHLKARSTRVSPLFKRRRRFTMQEKTAIKEGVKQCGVGNWSKIKAKFPVILKDRTAVNIKDCYRTMMSQERRASP